jgi:hypothetical protein
MPCRRAAFSGLIHYRRRCSGALGLSWFDARRRDRDKLRHRPNRARSQSRRRRRTRWTTQRLGCPRTLISDVDLAPRNYVARHIRLLSRSVPPRAPPAPLSAPAAAMPGTHKPARRRVSQSASGARPPALPTSCLSSRPNAPLGQTS